MYRLLIFIVLFNNLNIQAKDFNKEYKKLKGKWFLGTTIMRISCSGVSNQENNPFTNMDSFIVFKRNKVFYTNNNKTGKYYIENILESDTSTHSKYYLYLDSVKYDIIFEYGDLRMYFWTYKGKDLESPYVANYDYHLTRKPITYYLKKLNRKK